MNAHFPSSQWETVSPADAGFHTEKLQKAQVWLDAQGDDYRVAIVRNGYLVTEWNRNVDRAVEGRMASAAKSVYSCALARAIEDGKIASADARVVDYYPAMMDIPDSTGPKPGRYAFPKDRAITFRQLISNTSGYMKPNEPPGQVFHYQTYGMNILCHAIAHTYGLWDPNNPEGSPGLAPLFDRWFREPLSATWGYYTNNFDLQPGARLGIFGYSSGIQATALDMARLGWLWRHGGHWGDQQLVPEAWVREATRVNDVPAYVADVRWRKAYGLGFWSNEYGSLWPSLPRDAFAASGAGRQHIWVCPSLDLVVVQSPGIYGQQDELEQTVLGLVVESL